MADEEQSGVRSTDSSTNMASVAAANWQDEALGAQLCINQAAKEAADLEESMNTNKEHRRD